MSFDREGLALAGRLQALTGGRATVLYEPPWGNPPRRVSARNGREV